MPVAVIRSGTVVPSCLASIKASHSKVSGPSPPLFGGPGVGVGWNHDSFWIGVLIFYRLLGDCIERRAEVGVVGRGGFDGLIGE